MKPFAFTLITASILVAFQSSSTPVLDPVPDAPIASGLALRLERFAVFPKSEPIREHGANSPEGPVPLWSARAVITPIAFGASR